jgi:hypothetical protein
VRELRLRKDQSHGAGASSKGGEEEEDLRCAQEWIWEIRADGLTTQRDLAM